MEGPSPCFCKRLPVDENDGSNKNNVLEFRRKTTGPNFLLIGEFGISLFTFLGPVQKSLNNPARFTDFVQGFSAQNLVWPGHMNRVFRLGPTRNTKASKFQPIQLLRQFITPPVPLSLSQFFVESHFNRFEALSVSPIEVASEARKSLHYSHFNFLIMSDEEPVDPKREIEESICKPKCVKPLLDYQACVKRIKDDESGHKHCTGQYFDYWSCIDKCVAPKLFAKLK